MAASQIERENRLGLAHIYTATAALALGAVFGLLQGWSRARWFTAPHAFDYYRMLTMHGVLMALVFTTFFIAGLATIAVYRTMPRQRSLALGWAGFWVMLAGTVAVAAMILSGNATVLYTFYAPLKAHPLFYIGATVLVIGTWIVLADIVENAVWFKRNNPTQKLPLPAHAAVCTFVMWFVATLGVAAEMLIYLIPWSLGWRPTIDVMMTRMLFWYFGHPLVYFWIMGAYLIWYNLVPTRYGGTVFSDAITRVVFIMLILLSTPVGLHHEFTEPAISAGWKWVHTMNTYGVVVPSIITAFAIFASFEIAARRRGQSGFIGVIRSLPWSDPVFAGPAFGMLLFILGGFGGLVNASYAMDAMVHNTMWIVGHFHVTVGGPVALTFVGAAYYFVPKLTGRKLWAPKVALAQEWAWFVGMLVMSTSMHIGGLLGSPRRTDDVSYFGASAANAWAPEMIWAAIGGSILFVSIILFAIVALGTRFADEKGDTDIKFADVDPEAVSTPLILDRVGMWGAIALILAVIAYIGPVMELVGLHGYGAPGMRTW